MKKHTPCFATRKQSMISSTLTKPLASGTTSSKSSTKSTSLPKPLKNGDKIKKISETTPTSLDEVEGRLKTANDNWESVKAEITDMKVELNATKQEVKKANDNCEALKAELAEIADLKAELNATKQEVKKANDNCEALKAELAEMKAELATTKENLADSEVKHKITAKQLEVRRPEASSSKMGTQPVQQAYNGAKSAEIEDGNGVGDDALQSAYGKIPYDTVEELKEFADDLKAPKMYGYLKSRLKFIGGNGVHECIVAVLNAIMTPNLQGKISLTGKGTTKPSLKSGFKSVFNLIHDVVQVNNKDYQQVLGNEIIGKLLRSRANH